MAFLTTASTSHNSFLMEAPAMLFKTDGNQSVFLWDRVKHGCVMPGFVFNIAINWIMKNTRNAKRVLKSKFITVLEDLDYSGDIALLLRSPSEVQPPP